MLIDLKENKSNFFLNFKKNFDQLYDYIIIGSGPAASILINKLIKTKKKILVLEKGSFGETFYDNLESDNFKIKSSSRVFGVGGTSNTWSQVYSLFSKTEMHNFKNKNIWPLSHKELIYWIKKIGPKYKFNIKNLGSEDIYKKKFYLRKFIEIKKPLKFSKYFKTKKIDMIVNCEVKTIDNFKKYGVAYFKFRNKVHFVKSKKLIICSGGIESSLLVLRSFKNAKLRNLKNKQAVGRYFMDHPKCYVGEIKYPKKDLIKKFKLVYKKNINTYTGLSLYDKKKRILNTYVRFEEKKFFLNFRKKIMLRIFLEMEPRFRNRIYLKKSSKKVDLLLSKKENQISKKLIKEIINFFSYNPKLEKLDFNKDKLIGASHHMGGLSYPKILDKNLKLRGLNNIFCCSSAVFPTSGSTNPTLIICALSERLSEFLKK